MSALYKNAKNKVSQLELRKLMNQHKNKLKVVQKIESPLAKYTDSGELMCILCKSIVRSEAVWKVHINTKQHKENVESAKKLKDQINQPSGTKRPASPVNIESKKIKSILKNGSSKNVEIPNDFFDSNPKNKVEKTVTINTTETKVDDGSEETAMELDETLPEGFFDDPKQDAKARNLEYKDPVEEEWEKFQKEIKEVDNKSAEIIADDQEEATTERQIDEIEEQMRNWSRVLDLEKKKEVVKVTVPETVTEKSESSSEDEDNFDEYLDWRSKKSFK